MKNKTRTDYSIKNAFASSIAQALSLLSSFIVRFFFVRYLSQEYLGVNGLFTNILTVFSLAELGIGSAIVFAMYKPIANNDIDKIKAYMSFYKKAYRLIALTVLVLGLLILPYLNFFINDTSNIKDLNLIYLLYLFDSVSSYLCVYKISILNATQKNYIYNFYQMICKIASTIFMCVVLVLTSNFILYLLVQIIFKLILNILTSIKADEIYPYIKDTKGYTLNDLERKSIFKNVYGLFCNQIGNVLINGTDNIIISKYVSLISVGLYSNYSLIINALSNFVGQLFNSIVASVGNHGAKEDKEKTYNLFKNVSFINFVIALFCTVILSSCINPFIELAFGKKYLLDTTIVIVIVINFYLLIMKNVVGTFKYALGIFWDDKYSTLIRAVINVILSVVLAKKYGIIGVLLATLISDLLTTLWYQPYILFTKGFEKKVYQYFKYYIFYGLITLIDILICFIAFKYIFVSNIFINLIIRLIISFVVVCISILFFRRSREYLYLKDIALRYLKRG